MGVVTNNRVRNVGTSSVKILDSNIPRQLLQIVNKHATQTVRIKFGSDVVNADVTAVQLITFSNVPTGGSFKLVWNALLTAAIPYSANAAAVQTALRAVTGLSSITVAGSFSLGFTITMTGATPNVDPNLPVLGVSANSLEIAAVTAVQTIQFSDVPDDGSFTISNGTDTTDPLDSTTLAADMQVALRLFTGFGSVTVAGDFTAGFAVTFTGVLGPVALLTIPDNDLTLLSAPVDVTVDDTTPGIAEEATDVTVATTVVGQYADGYLVTANGGQLNFNAGQVPVDAIYALASGANTRVEILEG